MADDRDDFFNDAHGQGRSAEPDRWPTNDEGPQGELDAPPARKSNTAKILLIVLAIIVIGAVLCCGGAGLIAYLNPPLKTTSNAAEIEEKTAAIADIAVPEGFRPVMAMDMNMYVMTMQMAFYDGQGSGMLMIAQVQAPQGADEAQMQQQLRQSMQQQNMGEQLTIKNSETKTVQVDGQDVDFLFSTATNAKDNSEWRQVSGAFPGKNGTAFLILQQPGDAFDEEVATEMLESISTK
ncbi:MAG: hypothetical protein H0T47_21730 [Planctomycetaceae bacterium]|nr:hypothetical protein [Planctomycetaceae bacterium]